MLDTLFLQLSALFGITLAVAFVVRLLKQPLIIAYIIAGIIAGPLFFKIVSPDKSYHSAFAEMGVVFLLFLIGLGLNFEHLKRIGRVSIIAGLAQVSITGLVGFGLLTTLGYQPLPSLYLALAITFSSTIIIVKLLGDKKETETVYGRYVIGLMLVQDLVAIVLMIIFTSLTPGNSGWSSLLALGKSTIELAAFVYFMARFILPRILDRIADSGEFLFIAAVAWCFGGATLIHLLGLPLEIGAIAAGVCLGSSPYQTEIASRLKPLRDFFLVIFFIILGSQMDITRLGTVLPHGIILTIFILLIHPTILYLVFRTLKFTRRNSFFSGLIAAQVSEFGFVLIFNGQNSGLLSGGEVPLFTLTALATIFISSYFIIYNQQIYTFLLPFFNRFGKDAYQQIEEQKKQFDVWIFGHHRMGWKVCEALKEKGVSYAVVDIDPEMVKRLKRQGIEAIFGDASDIEFLSALPLAKAKMIISTIPHPETEKILIHYIRSINERCHLIATLTEARFLHDLYHAGADFILLPHLLGGAWFSDILINKAWQKKTFSSLKKFQLEELRLRFSHETI